VNLEHMLTEIVVCVIVVRASTSDHIDRIRHWVSNDQSQVSAVVLILPVSSLRWYDDSSRTHCYAIAGEYKLTSTARLHRTTQHRQRRNAPICLEDLFSLANAHGIVRERERRKERDV
jgi:hypothetical protein